MKSTIKLLFILLLAVSISSCKKDDNTPSLKNSIELDGESFIVTQAAIIGIAMGEDGHAAIYFYNVTSSLTKTLIINVEYTDDNDIDGHYAFPQTTGALYLDDWLTNYTEMDGVSNNSTNLESGTVDIKFNGGKNYTVTMDLTMTDGKVFAGEYTGEFEVQFSNVTK